MFTEELEKLPAPAVAVRYYTEGDFYLFGELNFCFYRSLLLFPAVV